MYFDVPKVVRSPGCDHGHDEESRNGRDVKIYILDDYIRTSERFRVIPVFFGVPESYGNSPGSIWALLGHMGIVERGHKEGGAPLVRIGQGVRPPFPSSSPSLSPFSYSNKKGGSPTPGGSRTPLGAPLLGRPPPPPLLLYIRGQGDTSRHNNN